MNGESELLLPGVTENDAFQSDDLLAGTPREPDDQLVAIRPPSPNADAASGPSSWRVHGIRPGENLSLILAGMGVSATQVAALAEADATRVLRNLRPGQQLSVQLDENGVAALRYDVDALKRLEMSRAPTGFTQRLIEQPTEHIQALATGTITSSLYAAAQSAGLSDRLVMELAEVFGWDIDFTLDLRAGDRFTVVYEQVHARGEHVSDGPILAAEFVNKGRVLRAVRFTNAAGRTDYYTPTGQGLRKAFNRNPLPVTRITSRFNPNRLHPIFRTRRPHRGVDYGAPTGTPVRATGDGVVVSAGRKGGYGNAVVLAHGRSYRTLYGHLSRFARGLHSGQRVRQGQLIGYVGATGWATGPHLHYEFQVNGVHKDPLRVQLPHSEPIADGELPRFSAGAAPWLAALDSTGSASVARAPGP